jgi:predicted cation transporter
VRASLDIEPGPAAVGTVVGLAGLLFLLEPVAGPVAVGDLRVRPVALSAAVLAAGLCLGAVVFYRRGRRLFALAHGIFGVSWTGIVAGTVFGSGTLLLGSVVVLIAGCGFLVSQARGGADR